MIRFRLRFKGNGRMDGKEGFVKRNEEELSVLEKILFLSTSSDTKYLRQNSHL